MRTIWTTLVASALLSACAGSPPDEQAGAAVEAFRARDRRHGRGRHEDEERGGGSPRADDDRVPGVIGRRHAHHAGPRVVEGLAAVDDRPDHGVGVQHEPETVAPLGRVHGGGVRLVAILEGERGQIDEAWDRHA